VARKRVALLCGQPEEYCQELFIKGFNKTVMEAGFDVCVFAMYQKYQDSPQREIGDSSIFRAINYSKFEAVVVMCDSIQTPGCVEDIIRRLKSEFKGKVILVESDSKDFPVELSDNYHPIKTIINHLIEEHGYTDIAFVTGKYWHPHSQKRLAAFKDAMAEHDLKVPENRIFYGDFWYTSGESIAEKLTRPGLKLPQAVACANDAMAIGLAKTLIAKGIKVPEDIAIVGYDSNDEGKHSPVPLTSADLPLRQFGDHCAKDILSMLEGGQPTEFVSSVDMFIGRTCGCEGESIKPQYELRKTWDTELSGSGVFSVFSHMNEDLLNQLNYTGLVNAMFSYIYQIRPFETFSFNVNNEWEEKNEKLSGSMLQLMRSTKDGLNDSVNFDTCYDLELMVPELYEDYETPRVFYFTPLHFDDRIFGFTCISYADPDICVDSEYRIWNRRCMIAFEMYRRMNDSVKDDLKNTDIRIKDSLTGLLNYRGFLARAESIIGKMHNRGGYISVLAVDVKNLATINEKYGRSEGDKVIVNTASLLEATFYGSDSLCICLGNGEFVVLRLTSSPGNDDMLKAYDVMKDKLNSYNEKAEDELKIYLYFGIESGSPTSGTDLERLINTAVSIKNANKVSSYKSSEKVISQEEEQESIRVGDVLANNRLNYYFQPIVATKDGEIFAYEALMRPDAKPFIEPPVVLHYAELMGKLHDVEKLTFNNVADIVCQREDIFDGSRKIFINSIPGQRLTDGERDDLMSKTSNYTSMIVVELTEQSELTDDELAEIKAFYKGMGIETAVDDYGTGYSNVTNLLRYMPRYVKIDRMLLTDIQESPQKQHFVKDIITFSHNNGIIVLAEGVETTAELRTVIMLGADLIQGFYTARPSAEIISAIDPKIRNEIVKYREEYSTLLTQDVFEAGKQERIHLASLSDQGITKISVSNPEATFIDFEIRGTPGLFTNIALEITNSCKGSITLDNVSLGTGNLPALVIQGDSSPVINLKGRNRLSGGIDISGDSSLTLEGDGELVLILHGNSAYDIKNNPRINLEDFSGTVTYEA